MLNVACHAVISRLLRDFLLERQCLDKFHGAALGHKWPLEWHWDLDSRSERRRGVVLDEESRVVALSVNFDEEEGEV